MKRNDSDFEEVTGFNYVFVGAVAWAIVMPCLVVTIIFFYFVRSRLCTGPWMMPDKIAMTLHKIYGKLKWPTWSHGEISKIFKVLQRPLNKTAFCANQRPSIYTFTIILIFVLLITTSLGLLSLAICEGIKVHESLARKGRVNEDSEGLATAFKVAMGHSQYFLSKSLTDMNATFMDTLTSTTVHFENIMTEQVKSFASVLLERYGVASTFQSAHHLFIDFGRVLSAIRAIKRFQKVVLKTLNAFDGGLKIIANSIQHCCSNSHFCRKFKHQADRFSCAAVMDKLPLMEVGINEKNLNFDSGALFLIMLEKFEIDVREIEKQFNKSKVRLDELLESSYKEIKTIFNLDSLTTNILPFINKSFEAIETINATLCTLKRKGIDKVMLKVDQYWYTTFVTMETIHCCSIFIFILFFVWAMWNLMTLPARQLLSNKAPEFPCDVATNLRQSPTRSAYLKNVSQSLQPARIDTTNGCPYLSRVLTHSSKANHWEQRQLRRTSYKLALGGETDSQRSVDWRSYLRPQISGASLSSAKTKNLATDFAAFTGGNKTSSAGGSIATSIDTSNVNVCSQLKCKLACQFILKITLACCACFSSLTWLFSASQFYLGAAAHTEVCRYLNTEIGMLQNDVQMDKFLGNALSPLIKRLTNLSELPLNLRSPRGVVRALSEGCREENATLFLLLGLGHPVDVRSLVAGEKVQTIFRAGRNIARQKISLMKINQLIPADTKPILTKAKEISKIFIDNVDYSASLTELQKPFLLIQRDIELYFQDLLNISTAMQLEKPDEEAAMLQFAVEQLRNNQLMLNYIRLQNELRQLQIHFLTLQNTRLITVKVKSLQQNLLNSQTILNVRTNKLTRSVQGR